MTEAGTKRRASLHVVQGTESLKLLDAGGIDVLASDLKAFRSALSGENHTLKRALTDPRILSGIGNAYSDEILHAARLSPLLLTQKLDEDQWSRLFTATQETLRLWIDRLQGEAQTGFPEKVTAFRKEMSVHGRFGQPCPRCREPVQRIRYADKETNYCRPMPDGREAPRGPGLVAAIGCGLAAHVGRAGSLEAVLSECSTPSSPDHEP